jgi:hypothetical protein
MSAPPPWTTPEDVQAQVARRWEDGRLLAAGLLGERLFPFRLSLRAPRAGDLGERFDEVKSWIRRLADGSKESRGYGYEIGWAEVECRVLGRNRLPKSIVIPTEEDALRLIRRSSDAQRFRALADETLTAFPVLRDWLARRPLLVVEHAAEWGGILAVLRWFREHPRPRLYLRQLDIPGVDTKFIESRRGLLAQLLDQALPGTSIDKSYSGAPGFEGRYGLRTRPTLVRLRFLDPAHYIHGFSDLTVPVAELAGLDPAVTRVFVTENEINGLSFPDVRDGLVIFGLGYGLDRLSAIPWLRTKALYYWGDIDTHGFAILSKLRASLDHAISFLMERDTLMAHRHLWVREDERHEGDLPRLRDAEQALFDDLRRDRLGESVRLEQERIAFGCLARALDQLAGR